MERVRKKTLKTELFTAVFITLLIVAFISAVSVIGLFLFQKWLVPDNNYVMLHTNYIYSDGRTSAISSRFEIGGKAEEFPYFETISDGVSDKDDLEKITISLESVDYGIGWNGPRRKLAYIASGISMAVFPVLYSVIGFVLCARWFYRKKLAPAILTLEDATEHISRQDLDFTVSGNAENELGRLCRSFEQMRRALYENNRELWKNIEDRKLIQASVAHDLRNPIAIIKAYTEYLQLHLQAGNLSSGKIEGTVDNIAKATKRLEQYTESVREINQLDDIEIHRTQVLVKELVSDITEDLSLMTAEQNMELCVTNTISIETISIDTSVLYRVLENIVGNALRFADKTICISFAAESNLFAVTVTDDGEGYSEKILKSRNRLLLPTTDENGHCGMGLTISRILCRKHGGKLELSNHVPHGAVTKILFEI